MARTKDIFQITGQTIPDVVRELNFILQRIADRLDQIEGIRGTSTIEGTLEATDIAVSGDISVSDDDETVIHSME